MWIITPIGFFSIVQKPLDGPAGMLTVRARAAGDMDALRSRFLPALGPTITGEGTDYPYRARAPKEAIAVAMLQLTLGIDYANFKNEVAKRQGYERAHVYGSIWSTLLKLESESSDSQPAPPPPTPSGSARSPSCWFVGGSRGSCPER